MLRGMGTKRNLCNKYYTTSDGFLTENLRTLLSSHGFVHKPASPQFDRLFRNGTLVYEFPTLQQLWLHCKEEQTSSVIYMHTLGSHKSWSLRRQFTRRVLQGQVLHGGFEECVDLPGMWHCGPNPNFSQCWEHYSGFFSASLACSCEISSGTVVRRSWLYASYENGTWTWRFRDVCPTWSPRPVLG